MTIEFEMIPYEKTKAIDFNFDQLNVAIDQMLEKYQNMVVTEETTKEAAADVAYLNRVVKAIEDKRKEVKTEYLEPYSVFEAKVKQIVAKIEQPKNKIKEAIDGFRAAQNEAKKVDIQTYFDEFVESLDLIDYVTFADIWSDKWLNVGEKTPDIKKGIKITLERMKSDIKIIFETDAKYQAVMLNSYKRNHDLGVALTEKANVEAQEKRVEEAKALKEMQEEKRRAEELDRMARISAEPEIIQNDAPEPTQKPSDEAGTTEASIPVYTITLKLTADVAALKALKQYLTDNNIEYKNIKE